MGSAKEMISHLPFVTGSDGEYTVLGRGTPEIYINGRKVRDKTELDRLQANEILSAEIITTPGVQYGSSVGRGHPSAHHPQTRTGNERQFLH